VPGEGEAVVRDQLEDAVRVALGPASAEYEMSYRSPWFEPALVDKNALSVRLMTGALRSVCGGEPRLSVISKQDVFVLNNHAKIPTISFGVGRWGSERGAYHQPDEAVSAEHVWTGCQVVHEAVTRWLEAAV